MFLILLRRHINEKGIKFSEIAEKMKKSISYVNEIHKGRRIIKVEDIFKFADALSLNIQEKNEFIETYMTEKYSELYDFMKMNIQGVNSIPLLEYKKLEMTENPEESEEQIPFFNTGIENLIALKLGTEILTNKFRKNDYMIVRLNDKKGLDTEYTDNFVLYKINKKLKIGRVEKNNEKYYMKTENGIDEENIKNCQIIGYIIGKYTEKL